MSTEKSNKNAAFWEKYRYSVISSSIPEAKAEWYLKWAQRFALSSPGALNVRKASDVNAFMDRLAAQPGVEIWQVAQASEALRILYR